MAVGTVGSVKGITGEQLKNDIQAPIILGNTYHLYLRPGTANLEQAGGLHRFMNWDRPMLTDSGGYQVYSLSQIRKLTPDGVTFRSHIDGSSHTFTPEKAMEIQRSIGADIVMAFDECTPYPCEKNYAKSSMDLTHKWLLRCRDYMNGSEPLYGHEQTLFPIVQGSVFPDLRKESAEFIASVGAAGNAIGGLSVGEPHEDMYAMTDLVCGILPSDKPRYLMGVGTPENLLECIALGVDMFDCVMPTRNGRNGTIFTTEGILNIRNKKWANDFGPLDPVTMPEHSKAYLRHLFAAGEMLGPILASIQNLRFYQWLMKEAGKQIEAGTFAGWKNQIIPRIMQKP